MTIHQIIIHNPTVIEISTNQTKTKLKKSNYKNLKVLIKNKVKIKTKINKQNNKITIIKKVIAIINYKMRIMRILNLFEKREL